ncbi:MAG: rhodanese-like domain-containing protein [Desulfarculus sp.]|nr:rhodanese-like domain-containing protein [Desulfarculus sp.]
MKTSRSLFMLSLAALLCLSLATPAHAIFDKELDNEKLVMNFHNEVKRGGYQVVDTAGLKKWLDEKKPLLIVDTMPLADSYKKQHIPGAVQFELPIPEMTEMSAAQQAELAKLLGPDKDRLLVIYCGFPKCTRSHNGAMWAVKMGYRQVYRYPGGIKAWAEAGHPVAKVE